MSYDGRSELLDEARRLQAAITNINYYVSYFSVGDAADVVWTVIQFVPVIPVVILGIIRLLHERMKNKEAILINRVLLAFYVGCLVVGSCLPPIFYPGYFAQSSVLI